MADIEDQTEIESLKTIVSMLKGLPAYEDHWEDIDHNLTRAIDALEELIKGNKWQS